MRKTTLWKLVAVIVAAVLVHAPAVYACAVQGCVSPCVSHPQLYDYSFDSGCAWVTTGSSSTSTSGGGTATVDNGSVYQDIAVGSYTSFHLAIDIDGIYGNASSERYRLTIKNTSGVDLEVIDIFWPADNPSGRYDYDIGNYSNSTIRVSIGRLGGIDPGDSVMVVNWIELWGRDF